MSPEQAAGRGDLVGPATDVYSLGATLYVLLTGQPPFEGGSGDLLDRVQRGEFAAPRQRYKEIPRALEAICLKAMTRQPEQRYATALDIAGEPVSAWHEPWIVRGRRWLGRHRTLATAAAACVLVAAAVAVAGMALLAAANDRERQRANEANEQRQEAERQKQKSDAHFKLAREAVDRFHTQVSESSEFKAHGPEPLRQKLLQSVVDFYQRFVQEEPDNLDLQVEQGRAYRRLGTLYRTLGNHERAEKAFNEALAIFQRIDEAYPQQALYQRELAHSQLDLAVFHSALHHSKPAESAFQQARTLFEQLAQTSLSAELCDQRDLARAERFLGRFYYESGRRDLAEKAYRRALALRQSLADAHPHDRQCRSDLADSQSTAAVPVANHAAIVK